MGGADDPRTGAAVPTIGLAGALSIGIGGIIGGGFFATFGITIAGAKGGTPVSFLIAGIIALFTAYSYVGLSIRYPGPGGTVTFICNAFGRGVVAASINVLLILSYIAVMAVYAAALASYSVPYLPAASRGIAAHVIASVAVVIFGLVNFAGAGLMTRLEWVFNIGKLGVLGLFIVAGLLVGEMDWSRLESQAWPPVTAIVASGMLGFLAYEGFELIANASGAIKDRARALPIAFLGSVAAAIVVYALCFLVAIAHLSFDAIGSAESFAISAAAESFLGPAGFAVMAAGAVLASASAINADYFGASKLPVMLSEYEELASEFARSIRGRSAVSLATIGALALVAVNGLGINALSAATSGGFLVVFAAVNIAAVKLAPETGSKRWISMLAALLCLGALAVMVAEFLSDASTRPSGIAVGAIILAAIAIEAAYRSFAAR